MKDGLTRRGLFGLGGAAGSVAFISWPFSSKVLSATDEILVNQVGYFAGDAFEITVRSEAKVAFGSTRFELINCDTDRSVRRITAKVATTTEAHVGKARLPGFKLNGSYCLKSGPVTSHSFTLSADPWAETERTLVRALYLQRCGAALSDPETGLKHGSCHQQDAISRTTRTARNCTGGWHDAGDFGKYVATTSVVIGEILSLYNRAPTRFKDGALGIPEGGDGEPDLLGEMRVGLAWLLRMQQPWGAFERKVSGGDWPSMTAMPEDDTQERFSYGVSTADTARASAALAIAARTFEPVDPVSARQFLVSAEKGWEYLQRRPRAEIDIAPGDDNGSGSYVPEDRSRVDWDREARYWAALELHLATGEEKYREAMRAAASRMYVWPASWANPSLIGLLNHLRDERRPDVEGLRPEITKRLVERADEFEKTARLSPWSVATLDFAWGSNREVAARGRILVAAFEETGEEKYLTAARAQADYILGRNAVGLSFVTGAGTKSVQNPHHRFDLASRSSGRQKVIPGLLVGGPNRDTSGSLAGVPHYADNAASFETNEFAIDHNAALLSLLGRLGSLERPAEPGFLGRILRWIGL